MLEWLWSEDIEGIFSCHVKIGIGYGKEYNTAIIDPEPGSIEAYFIIADGEPDCSFPVSVFKVKN